MPDEREDDPNVRIPAAVRNKIGAFREAFAAQQSGEQPPVSAEPPPQSTQPEVTAAVPPPVTEQEEQPPPSDASVSQEDDHYSKLLQQHRSLQGKYNSETASLRNTMLLQSRQIEDMTRQITNLTARVVTQPLAEKKDLTPERKRAKPLTEDEVNDIGPDLVDAIGRKAQEIAEELLEARLQELGVADLAPKVRDLTGSVETLGKSAAETRKARFVTYMDSNVPGWREQDIDPLFLEWLRAQDEFSGMLRGSILRSAMETEDFNRVKLIFEGYATEQGVLAHATTRTRASSPPAVKLETMAAPNGSRGRTETIVPTGTPEAPLTGPEISAYYRRRALKPNSISEAEVARMERRISSTIAASGATGRH